MARQVILAEDGPLGEAGTLVWVNDEDEKPAEKPAAKKSTTRAKKSSK